MRAFHASMLNCGLTLIGFWTTGPWTRDTQWLLAVYSILIFTACTNMGRPTDCYFVSSTEKILELIQQALSDIAESRLSTKWGDEANWRTFCSLFHLESSAAGYVKKFTHDTTTLDCFHEQHVRTNWGNFNKPNIVVPTMFHSSKPIWRIARIIAPLVQNLKSSLFCGCICYMRCTNWSS